MLKIGTRVRVDAPGSAFDRHYGNVTERRKGLLPFGVKLDAHPKLKEPVWFAEKELGVVVDA